MQRSHSKLSNGLSLQETKFVNHYIKSGNGTQSIYKAGYNVKNDSTASAMSSELLERPRVKRAIETSLESAGLGVNSIAIALEKIINAGLSKSSIDKATPDHALKGLDMVARLANLYPDKHSTVDTRSVLLEIATKDDVDLDQIYSKMLGEGQEVSVIEPEPESTS